MKIKYRRITVEVEGTRPLNCDCCGREGKIDYHHWKYFYKTSEVRKNHEFALKNGSFLCFPCHRVADSMRFCFNADTIIFLKLTELMLDIHKKLYIKEHNK